MDKPVFTSILWRDDLYKQFKDIIDKIPPDPVRLSSQPAKKRKSWNQKNLESIIKSFGEDPEIYKVKSDATPFISKNKNGLSSFPPEWACFILTFYSEEGDKVLIPFLERGEHMIAGLLLGRDMYGVDINPLFVKVARYRAKQAGFDVDDKCIVGDSRKLTFDSDSFDLVFGSPPYWDTEFYGYIDGNIGLTQTYSEFLNELSEIIKECFRVLKSNKFFVLNVNDFRRKGKFYAYHKDCIDLCEEIGFVLHDIVICNYVKFPMVGAFKSMLWKHKYTAKNHEYLLVFKKP